MSEQEIRHITVKLSGHVQGVGLRYAIMHKALDYKMQGFVTNLDTANEVYFEAQGKKADLEELVNWCRKNPAWAQVDNFEVQEKPLEELSIFYIKY